MLCMLAVRVMWAPRSPDGHGNGLQLFHSPGWVKASSNPVPTGKGLYRPSASFVAAKSLASFISLKCVSERKWEKKPCHWFGLQILKDCSKPNDKITKSDVPSWTAAGLLPGCEKLLCFCPETHFSSSVRFSVSSELKWILLAFSLFCEAKTSEAPRCRAELLAYSQTVCKRILSLYCIRVSYWFVSILFKFAFKCVFCLCCFRVNKLNSSMTLAFQTPFRWKWHFCSPHSLVFSAFHLPTDRRLHKFNGNQPKSITSELSFV